MKIYRGRVCTPNGNASVTDIHDAGLVVAEDGRILSIGPWDETWPQYQLSPDTSREIAHFRNAVILPGFVDVHTHLPQLGCMGRAGYRLQEWLQRFIFPAEARFTDNAVARNTAGRFFATLLQSGTTTAMVFSSIHQSATAIAFEEAQRSGIRAIVGKTLMDANSPSDLLETTHDAIDHSVQLYEQWHNTCSGRLMYAFSPRFAVTCSLSLMSLVAEAAQVPVRGSLPYIQTHLSESREEVEAVRRLFPAKRHYTAVYSDTGLLGSRTVLAHAIHLNTDEYKLIAKSQSSVAHCPSSNFFLKSGTMDLQMMRRYGIRVGVGTDIGAGPETSLLRVLKDAYYAYPDTSLEAEALLYLGTLGGAEALGLASVTGSLEVGKQADFIVVDPRLSSSDEIDAGSRLGDLLPFLLFRGDDRVIQETYVAGRRVLSAEIREDRGDSLSRIRSPTRG